MSSHYSTVNNYQDLPWVFWQQQFYCVFSKQLHKRHHTDHHLQHCKIRVHKLIILIRLIRFSKQLSCQCFATNHKYIHTASILFLPNLCFMAISVLSISHLSGSGLKPNTVGLFLLGAGYNRVVTSPSAWMEWWWTSSAKVLNLWSDVTYTWKRRNDNYPKFTTV